MKIKNKAGQHNTKLHSQFRGNPIVYEKVIDTPIFKRLYLKTSKMVLASV